MQIWKKILVGFTLVGFTAVIISSTLLILLVRGDLVNKKLGGGVVTGRLNYSERTVLNAVAATTTGSAFNVADFALLGWTFTGTSVSGTIKFACSRSETAPDFTASQSVTNRWSNVSVKDSESGSTIAGNIGVVFVNSTTIRQFEMVNANFRWCTAVLSPWTAGTSTITLLNATNQ